MDGRNLVAAALAGIVAGAGASFALRHLDAAPAPVEAPKPIAPPEDAEARRLVRELEGRVAVLEAAVSRQGEELATARAALAAGASGTAGAGAASPPAEGPDAAAEEGKPSEKPDMDRFAKEVAKGMRQGIRQQFQQIADLVLNPTPELLDQRKKQLEFFSQMVGSQAGLDAAQQSRLAQIFEDVDVRARDDLRNVLTATEDPAKLDWGAMKQVNTDAFASQDRQFDDSFPKEKADRLKQQMAPMRSMFGAMLDEMEKQAKSPPEK
jgi:hypothetical protein